MKLISVVFDKPVKVRGNMAQSLSASSEVGRLGTAAPVQMTLEEGFVEVSTEKEGTLVVVPLGNVVCFVPAPPAPAPSKK